MDVLKVLFPCFGAGFHSVASDSDTSGYPPDEKIAAYTDFPSTSEVQYAANKILDLIVTAPALNTNASNAKLQEIINSGQPDVIASSSWWRNAVLERVYDGLKVLVASVKEHGHALSDPLHTLFADASAFAEKFRDEHSNIAHIVELIALGLLIEVLTPILLGALGFCGEGILEGSFAAKWQRTIGNVPYDSLFSKLQSLAAKYGKSLPMR